VLADGSADGSTVLSSAREPETGVTSRCNAPPDLVKIVFFAAASRTSIRSIRTGSAEALVINSS
jgi:hypothetical protein